MTQSPKWKEYFQKQYPPGTRIRLTEMRDPYSPVPPGTMGTVEYVDDACTIHMKWDNGRTLGLVPGEDSFSVVEQKHELTPFKLYIPLTIDHYEHKEYGDWEEYPRQITPKQAAEYADKILAAMVRYRHPEEAERGIMNWYRADDAVNAKVKRAEFSVEVRNHELWGTVACLVNGELSPEEMELFKEYLTGQSSDGWGEGFEQQEIEIPEGELYVHLWNSGKGWQIMTESELQQFDKEQTPQMNDMSY